MMAAPRLASLIGVATFAALLPALAQAQINPYVYVRMSLGVPWFLYFVFLACILIPFALLIILAWRRHLSGTEADEETGG